MPPEMAQSQAQMPPMAQSKAQTPGQRQQAGSPPESTHPRLQPNVIESIIQTDVVTSERDTDIQTVVAAMAEHDVGSVVVVDNDEPVGVITDRTVALALETTPDVSELTAEDLLSESLVTATTDMTLSEALQRLNDETIRRLPIVDDDGAIVGIVTLDDILVALEAELSTVAEIIEAQSPRL